MFLTSNSFQSLNQNLEILVRKAFERIEIADEIVNTQQLISAIKNIDFLLAEWSAQSIHLWTLKTWLYPLTAGQGVYQLPLYVNDITQINLYQNSRQLNGIAFGDGGGEYANAFNNDPDTACIQDSPGGFIAYKYNTSQAPDQNQRITLFGIQSNITDTYSANLEYSNDDGLTWKLLFSLETKKYEEGFIYWYSLPYTVSAKAYRVKALDNTTLNIRKIYFNNNVTSTLLAAISRNEFLSYSQPQNLGRPTVYYFDRQIAPILNIWMIPTFEFNVIQISYTQMIQDAGSLANNTLDIPARFYNALIFGLAHLLSIEYAPNKTEILKIKYNEALNIALKQDTPTVPFKIELDLSKYKN